MWDLGGAPKPDSVTRTRMKNLLLTLLHLAVMTAKLCGPGGARAVIAENLLLKQQLIVLRRARQRAPNLTVSDLSLANITIGPESLTFAWGIAHTAPHVPSRPHPHRHAPVRAPHPPRSRP